MYKIAVIGGSDSVIGFKALGLDAFPVEDTAEAKAVLHRIAQPGEVEYSIIYLEESLAKDMTSDVRKYDEKPSPAIILIPGRDGSAGLGLAALKEAVEKAVGSDIL